MFRKGYSLHKIPVYLLVFFLVVFQNNLINAQCVGTISASVTSNYNGFPVSCAGNCDGEITISMSFGGPYGYQVYNQLTNTYYPGPTMNDFQASPVSKCLSRVIILLF